MWPIDLRSPIRLFLPVLLGMLMPLAPSRAAGPSGERPDLSSVPADLETPKTTDDEPAAGKRVRQTIDPWKGTQVHHVLYLPTDWAPGKSFPVIVEYAGNGKFKSKYGDASDGTPEGSNLGYGLSGGGGFVWVCVPYVDSKNKKNEISWWGDPDATADYCRRCVRDVCERWGGDASAVFLTGFSRGAIACNYIGLRDDATADLWLAFIPYSHYDGVKRWNYPASDAASAIERLKRINGRASFVCQEGSTDATRAFIESTGVKALFTYQTIPFRNHNDTWAHRDTPARDAVRAWMKDVLEKRPGRSKRSQPSR